MKFRIGNENLEYEICANHESPLSLINTFVFNTDYIENICNLSTNGLNSILHIHKNGRRQIDNIIRIKSETKILFGSLKEIARFRRSKLSQMDSFLDDAVKEITQWVGWQNTPIPYDLYYQFKNFHNARFQVQSATPSPWVLASSKKTS